MGNRNWFVKPFTTYRARRQDGHALGGTVHPDSPLAVPITGASISDKDSGLIFEATIGQANGEVWLTSLTIHTAEAGKSINPATIHHVPVQRIAQAVSLHLATQERNSMPTFTTVTEETEDTRVGSLQEVAASFRQGGTRAAMAKRVGISVPTWDKRIREARDADHSLAEPTTGRPRQPQGPTDQELIEKAYESGLITKASTKTKRKTNRKKETNK